MGDWWFPAFSDFALLSETPDFAPSSETREAMSGKPAFAAFPALVMSAAVARMGRHAHSG